MRQPLQQLATPRPVLRQQRWGVSAAQVVFPVVGTPQGAAFGPYRSFVSSGGADPIPSGTASGDPRCSAGRASTGPPRGRGPGGTGPSAPRTAAWVAGTGGSLRAGVGRVKCRNTRGVHRVPDPRSALGHACAVFLRGAPGHVQANGTKRTKGS